MSDDDDIYNDAAYRSSLISEDAAYNSNRYDYSNNSNGLFIDDHLINSDVIPYISSHHSEGSVFLLNDNVDTNILNDQPIDYSEETTHSNHHNLSDINIPPERRPASNCCIIL